MRVDRKRCMADGFLEETIHPLRHDGLAPARLHSVLRLAYVFLESESRYHRDIDLPRGGSWVVLVANL